MQVGATYGIRERMSLCPMPIVSGPSHTSRVPGGASVTDSREAAWYGLYRRHASRIIPGAFPLPTGSGASVLP